jgi:hypothetical protein
MRRSAICCKNMHGHRFEGGAAGEREEFRKTASEGEPIGLTARVLRDYSLWS